MFKAGSYHISIAELAGFVVDAKAVFTSDEYEELILYLARFPEAGDLIPGTGGVRKLRWGARGQGKRGGARVIYYFRDLNMPVYLLAVYTKGEKLNLTQREKQMMRQMVDDLAATVSARRLRIAKRT